MKCENDRHVQNIMQQCKQLQQLNVNNLDIIWYILE